MEVEIDLDELDATSAETKAAKQPKCPKEKEDAIVEALKAFQIRGEVYNAERK